MAFPAFHAARLAKVHGEWDLVCAAFNLRRLRGFAVACG